MGIIISANYSFFKKLRKVDKLEYNDINYFFIAGWSSLVARQAHNLKVLGSNPSPATNFIFFEKLFFLKKYKRINKELLKRKNIFYKKTVAYKKIKKAKLQLNKLC